MNQVGRLVKFSALMASILLPVLGNSRASMAKVRPIDRLTPSVSCGIRSASRMFWFGTYDQGIVSYDGLRTQTFTTADSLAGNSVASLFEDSFGRVWAGTDHGLSQWDGSRWRTFRGTDYLAGDLVSAIIEDSAGRIWFATDQGVSYLDGVQWHPHAKGAPAASCFALDRQGTLWAGTDGFGLYRQSGESWQQVPYPQCGDNYLINAILVDTRGVIWVCTSEGLIKGSGMQFECVDPRLGPVEWAHEDPTGVLWFDGGVNGVWRVSASGWRNFGRLEGLPPGISTMLDDDEGNLVCGATGGVSLFDRTDWDDQRRVLPAALGAVSHLHQDHSGAVWAVFSGGTARLDADGWTVESDREPALRKVRDLGEDGLGRMWFACPDGLSRHDDAGWWHLPTAAISPSGPTRVVCSASGDIWFTTSGGISRYDGQSLVTFDPDTGPPRTNSIVVQAANAGEVWAWGSGWLGHYQGDDWWTYRPAEVGEYTGGLLRASDGQVWTWASDQHLLGHRVLRFDGRSWSTYEPPGFPAFVSGIMEESPGVVWVLTLAGIARYDGAWSLITEAQGLTSRSVKAAIKTRDDGTWVAGDRGLSRFDGTWERYPLSLLFDDVGEMAEDDRGNVWVLTRGKGLIRAHNGTAHLLNAGNRGVGTDSIIVVLGDRSRDILWVGTPHGLVEYHYDQVAPTSRIAVPPPSTSGTSVVRAAFGVAYDDPEPVQFSYSLDAESWSSFGNENVWSRSLPDGAHVLRLRTRDLDGNVDATPDSCRFFIDARPPEPTLDFPPVGAVVRDSLIVRVTADDTRLARHQLRIISRSDVVLGSTPPSAQPLRDQVIGRFDTRSWPDGQVVLRLEETDSLGLQGVVTARIVVDNEWPPAAQTTREHILKEVGGEVYSERGDVVLRIPPGGLSQDSDVVLDAAVGLPDTVPGGGVRLSDAYAVSWPDAAMKRYATLEFRLTEPSGGQPFAPAVFEAGSDGVWARLGGTNAEHSDVVVVPIERPGTYALFDAVEAGHGSPELSAIAIAPRVLRSSLGPASIRFRLGAPGPVDLKVFNCAGRLVRTIAERRTMAVGWNVLSWDATDDGGRDVLNGLYLVRVGAQGRFETTTVIVAR